MQLTKSIAISFVALMMVLIGVSEIGTASSALANHGRATGWAIQTLPAASVAPNGHLSAVSCISVVSCTAVGYSHDGHGVDRALAESWDGSVWRIQATANSADANSTVLTGVSCTVATACVSVGDFIDADGRQLPLAQRWNGARWERQPIPNLANATESFLTGVSCTSASACVAVGYARTGNEPLTTFAEHWDGMAWQLTPTPVISGANGMRLLSVSCASATACSAVGFSGDTFADPQPVAERWDGLSWSLQTVPIPAGANQGLLSSVSCPTATQCVSVGHWHDSAKGGGTLAEFSDGNGWVVQPTPTGRTDVYNAVSCTASNACLAVGKSELSDFVAARWDGASWTSIAAPASGTLIDTNYVSLSCRTITGCIAVGAAETADYGFTYLPLAAGWNGSTWTSQPTVNPSGETANQLVAVSCATERSCVAVGYRWKAPDAAEQLIERWDGTSWRIATTPAVQGSSLSAVSCSANNDCLAVGSYVEKTGAFTALVEHWDGRSWSVEPATAPEGVIGTGLAGVSCRPPGNYDRGATHASNRSTCIAVGAYADASGASVMATARRSGTSWRLQAAPTPTGTSASALNAVSCATPLDCTAVGVFSTGPPTFPGPGGPCDSSCTVAEHWNGSSWRFDLPPAPQDSINSSLPSVSCPMTDVCLAAGQWSPQDRLGGHPGITLAESWSPAGWAVQATPDPPGVGGPNGSNNSPFEAVSCADQVTCTAVGNYDSGEVGKGFLPMAEHRDAAGWTVQPMPVPAGVAYNDLNGVSCPTVRMCMAVGSNYRYNVANLGQGPLTSVAELYSRP